MLSILIPVYNTDVTKLVHSLQEQCRKAKIVFEILVYDDYSKQAFKEKNKGLAQLMGVSYVEMQENLGRARIRNKLGRYSNHPNLLFIDSDSKIPNKSFIKNYLPYIGKFPVIYGGRIYTPRKPQAKKRILHWVYGTKREATGAKKRNRQAHLSFLSNNFILQREVFQTVRFDPDHEGYGYEDTLFATELAKRDIRIHHIDNPLIHTGIESAEVFLQKTKEALDNLVELHRKERILTTRLISFYLRLKRFGLDKTVFRFLDRRIPALEQNLMSENPSMYYLDAWKLHYFIQKMDEK
jgi:glycosyltransferase involved in cell wall biosynthesis